MSADAVLVINTGSSSLKFGLFAPGANDDEVALMDGAANGIGHPDGTLGCTTPQARNCAPKPSASPHSRRRLPTLASVWVN